MSATAAPPPPGSLGTGTVSVPAPVPLLTRISQTLERANLPLLASAIAFDAMLAVIPLGILVVAGLGYLLSHTSLGAADPTAVVTRFLPEHVHGPNDPFALIERLIGEIQNYRSRLTWIAVPLFLLLSTRVFAAVRLCLSQVFQVRQRPVHGHFVWSYVAGYLLGKARDVAIVAIVLLLALASTLTTTALTVATASGVQLEPQWRFLVTAGGRLAGHGVAFLFGIALFVLLYRYASPKRLAWGGALIASVVATRGVRDCQASLWPVLAPGVARRPVLGRCRRRRGAAVHSLVVVHVPRVPDRCGGG